MATNEEEAVKDPEGQFRVFTVTSKQEIIQKLARILVNLFNLVFLNLLHTID